MSSTSTKPLPAINTAPPGRTGGVLGRKNRKRAAAAPAHCCKPDDGSDSVPPGLPKGPVASNPSAALKKIREAVVGVGMKLTAAHEDALLGLLDVDPDEYETVQAVNALLDGASGKVRNAIARLDDQIGDGC